MNIYAFPYAVGTKSIFNEMKDLIIGAKLVAMEYPGHGTRFNQQLCGSIRELVEDAYDQIKDNLDKPYFLLGYSMGALVAFELFRLIESYNRRLPERIFLLASDSPEEQNIPYKCTNMNIELQRQILSEFGNTPDEVLENVELLSLISPILESDLNMINDYKNEMHGVKYMKGPVTIIRGTEEKSAQTSKIGWQKYIACEVEFILVEGDHFFLFNNKTSLHNCIKIIMRNIRRDELIS